MADDEVSEESEETSSKPEPESPKERSWTGEKTNQAAFLKDMVFHSGHVRKAAKSSKVTRQGHYQWLKTDEHYRELYADAMAQVTQVLEDEAIRRAVEGVKKGVYYQGAQCGTEIVY